MEYPVRIKYDDVEAAREQFRLIETDQAAAMGGTGINRDKLENFFHETLATKKRFLVPQPAIDAGLRRLPDGTNTDFVYGPDMTALVKVTG